MSAGRRYESLSSPPVAHRPVPRQSEPNIGLERCRPPSQKELLNDHVASELETESCNIVQSRLRRMTGTKGDIGDIDTKLELNGTNGDSHKKEEVN